MAEAKQKKGKLSKEQIRELRGQGHKLSPLIIVGKEGLSDSLVKEMIVTLSAHELVKAKILDNCPLDRQEAADLLAKRTGSAMLQLIGKTFLLYRENPKKYEKTEQKVEAPLKKSRPPRTGRKPVKK